MAAQEEEERSGTDGGARRRRRQRLIAGLAAVLIAMIGIWGVAVPRYREARKEAFVVGRYPVRVSARLAYCTGGVYVDRWLDADAPPDAALPGTTAVLQLPDGTTRSRGGWRALTDDAAARPWDGKVGTFTLYAAGAGNGHPYGWVYATFTDASGASIGLSQVSVDCA